MGVRPGLQQGQVTRQEAGRPGGLLGRQAAQEPEAERQRPPREREPSEAASGSVRLGPGSGAPRGQPGARGPAGLLPGLQVRLQAQQVRDGEAFRPEPGAVQPGLVDPEPRRQHLDFGFLFGPLFSSRQAAHPVH